MIRDLVIIFAGVIVILFMLVGLAYTWRIFRTLKRTAHKLEQTSDILLETASQPVNFFGILQNLVGRGFGFIRRNRS